MTVTSMALPVDIPWERWCVSQDMMATAVCATDRPAKWQSSIAVFKYVPSDDYQIYPQRKITYIKVVCTISGYQPKADEVEGILNYGAGITITDLSNEIEQATAAPLPCTEALVQVIVAPPQLQQLPLDQYPYFMDFQPKKREMLETATDTSEFMSRSLDSLNINKSAGSTQSQEVLDIDQGFSVGASGQGSYAGTGGGGSFNYSQQGQWGTKQMGGNQSGLSRTTDESHERRETTSHTAQITQLWHLLDSYHVGTNRALFFVQPRPHVLQAPSGFVGDAPRSIEGIQEFFLIVNQPQNTPDFCLDVRLDTGHLTETHVMDYDYKSDAPDPYPLSNPALLPTDPNLADDGTTTVQLVNDSFSFTIPFTSITVSTAGSYSAALKYHCKKRTQTNSVVYTPPTIQGEPYVIDVANLGNRSGNVGGYQINAAATQTTNDATYTVTVAPDGSSLTVALSATSRACFEGAITEIQENPTPISLADIAAAAAVGIPLPAVFGTWVALEELNTVKKYAGAPAVINNSPASAAVAIEVFLRSQDKVKDTGQINKSFIVTTRGLCCCQQIFQAGGGGGAAARIKQQEGIVYESNQQIAPSGTPLTVEMEKKVHAAMRQEMIRNIVSPRRTAPRPLVKTQFGMNLILPILLKDLFARRALQQPVASAVPPSLLRKSTKTFQKISQTLTRLQLLRMEESKLAKSSGLDEEKIHQLRVAALSKPHKPPVPQGLRKLAAGLKPKSGQRKPRRRRK